jgi:hypothetical protein
MMRYIPVGDPIPFDHSVYDRLQIPPIPRDAVGSVDTQFLDVTCYADAYKRVIPGISTVYDKDGSEVLSGPPTLIGIALQGGGDYLLASQNSIAGPITLAEHLAIEAEDAQIAAYEYWDD